MIILDERNILGKTIRQIRLNRKITQEQLAARLHIRGINMDRIIISRIEHQTRELYDFEIKAIARALDVKIQDLFGES
jgi:HTH-type transcriptional regulator, cell division transcriptional repressor